MSDKNEKPWYKKLEGWNIVLTLIILTATLFVLSEQSCSLKKQTLQDDSLFVYTKRRDHFQDSINSIFHLKDSINAHFRDSLMSVSTESGRITSATALNTFETVDRPYLTIDSEKTLVFKIGEPIKVGLWLKNNGSVEAIDVNVCTGIDFNRVPLDTVPPCLSKIGDNFPSHKAYRRDPLILDSVLTNAMDTDVAYGKRTIFIYVVGSYGRYKDKKRYTINECNFYNATGYGWETCRPPTISSASSNNKAVPH